jgi:twitching motility protein PilI
MDKRKTLRELQSRLADKLQAVRAGDVAASAAWLAVDSEGEKFLFPLSQSGEIFSWVPPHKVAHTQNWYLGVANLRGSLFGIADFASFVGGKEPSVRNQQSHSESRFVTLSGSLEVNCALQVDRLDGLRSAESFRESMLPETGSPAYFGHTYIDLHGVHWQEINLQLLAQQNSFLNINAY